MLIGYMRVSSENNDKQSTDLQLDALLAAGVDKRNIFQDHASGAKDNRPGLKEALEFLKASDTLIVWKLDRLGRSLPHLIETLNLLKEKNVQFKSLTEGMDTSTISGELLFHIVGALAQFERNIIKERVNAGLAAAKKRGRVGGRPKAISEEKLELICEALNNGMSKAAVCRTFDVKRSTLIDTLNRIGYTVPKSDTEDK
ncbi:MAG: recombinase family protein [Epsilonproteobacteria bacterium]|nr:recombinase family protein [Campylobacterota bacterium]MBD3839901.1 recombinase family protein [Campylobacterota bacterium]